MNTNIELLASILAGVMLIAATTWKVWLRVRSDKRGDHAAADSYESYGQVLEQMRKEIDRLSKTVNHLGTELESERKARYEAQRENSRLSLRIHILESEVRRLGGVVPE